MIKRIKYKPSSQNLSQYKDNGRIVALLGPTNTGKTHYAIDRMLSYSSGMIGFPLRLLAREVYDKIVAYKGKSRVALITGEEKIIPDNPAYYICTTESMPVTQPVEFLGIDEVQMAADWQRGHVFTDRILNARGRYETMFMGSDTVRTILKRLVPDLEVMDRPRFSKLSYSAPKRLANLARRTAIVAFRSEDVYGMAELLRREKGGAAIVMGSLSPRTRNAQVEMYQKGEVDYLVATDAIGMGLNMDIDHVALASTRKFDGVKYRDLTAAELAQVAGRAGRYQTNGTFSTLTDGDGELNAQMVEKLENHRFPPVKALLWRNTKLKFSSPDGLLKSLEVHPTTDGLAHGLALGPEAFDMWVLRKMAEKPEVQQWAKNPAKVRLLWEVCQIPDFQRVSPEHHVGLISTIYGFLAADFGLIPHEWMAKHVSRLDNCQGDIDTLAARIASVRIFTYISHRNGWLKDPAHWAFTARGVEDKLSDALHDRLTQRFVDRRTTELVKELRKKGNLKVSIENQDSVFVEGHLMGQMEGFSFNATKGTARDDHKSLKAAADKALREEVSKRAKAFIAAEDGQLTLDTSNGLGQPKILWRGAVVANLMKGLTTFQPKAKLLASSLLVDDDAEKVTARLDQWFQAHLEEEIGALFNLNAELNNNVKPEDDKAPLAGMARGIAFQLLEHYGILPREVVGDDLRKVELEERRGLHRYRIRIGSSTLYIQQLLKPAATKLRLVLWALWNDIGNDKTRLPEIPTPGMVWVEMDKQAPEAFYQIAGFTPAGNKAIRVDMVERLADAVRPLGARDKTDDKGFFETTPEIMGLVGLSGLDYANVMKAIGYHHQVRKVSAAEVSKARAVIEAKIITDKAEAQKAKEAAKAKIDASKDAQVNKPGDDKKPDAKADDKKAEANEAPAEVAVVEEAKIEAPTDDKKVEEAKVEEAKPEDKPVKDADSKADEKPVEDDQTADDQTADEMVDVYFFKWSGKRKPDNRESSHHNQNRPQNRPQGGGNKPSGKDGDKGQPTRTSNRGRNGPGNAKSGSGGKPSGNYKGNKQGPKHAKRGKPQRDTGPKTHSIQIKTDTSGALDSSSPFAALQGLKDTMVKANKPKDKPKDKPKPAPKKAAAEPKSKPKAKAKPATKTKAEPKAKANPKK
jgi:ATP-dependent RNA helicase SUPV3L1/SUV3